MSQEAISGEDPEIHNEKKDLHDGQIHSQKPEQNKRKTLERQVTLCDEEVKTMQETSFIGKEDIEPLSKIKTESIEKRESSEHIINTESSSHDLEDGDLKEDKEGFKEKKCQCLFEVFECTIWALRNIGRYISSRFRKFCCFCHKNSNDIRKREIIDGDDDGECWNVTENQGDESNYTLNNANAVEGKAIFHLNQGFDEGTRDISSAHCKYVRKSESDTKGSNADIKDDIEKKENRMSSTNVICPVNVHNEPHENFSHNNDVNESHSYEPTSNGNVDCPSNHGGGQDFSGGDSGCDAGYCD